MVYTTRTRVTRLSTNRTRRGLTSFMRRTPLTTTPRHQAVVQKQLSVMARDRMTGVILRCRLLTSGHLLLTWHSVYFPSCCSVLTAWPDAGHKAVLAWSALDLINHITSWNRNDNDMPHRRRRTHRSIIFVRWRQCVRHLIPGSMQGIHESPPSPNRHPCRCSCFCRTYVCV